MIRADKILSGDRYGEKITHKMISRYENAEIDDEYDFWLLEKTLEKMDSEGRL